MLLRSLAIIAIAAAGLLAGCNLAGPNRSYDAELAHYKQIAGTVDHPQLTTPPSDNLFTPQPRTIDHNAAPQQPQEWWDMSVEEALQTALARSSVLRDLGGTVIRSPDSTRTILGPSLIATEPRFGMEAALSEFDATLATSVVAEKNDRMINNFVASGGTRFFQQDLINFQSQLTKVGVAGTRMTLRGISTYDNNNASFNRFPSVWDSLYEAEIRQPLYQGAGSRFNRLAGPNSSPGFYNGVLIARVNTDISVADFEIGLRDLVSNVENAYWDLYFAYRDLDAKLQVRNASLEAWKKIKVALDQKLPEGTPEREAQAREQYFRYEEDVQNALAGTLQSSTTNNNGSSGGSFRGLGGVLVSERRLRLAVGLPITDGRMIRPADEPTAAKVIFDWPAASDDAIARRPELLRQRLAVKRREMEFVAARNFLLPRFDLIGRYRVRGLGKNLIGDVTLPPDPVGDPQGLFENSSLSNLALANFQEWQLGGEVSLPIGFRRGHAAVRNAQLFVAREKAVLEEQERQVIHDLSNALGDVERAYEIMQTSYNRRRAAQESVFILRTKTEQQNVTPEQLLEAERRLGEADTQYHKALVEHMMAIKNVHFEKGSLLEYGHILLSEQVSIVNARPPASDANHQPTPTPAPLPEPMPVPPPPAPAGPAPPLEVQHQGPPPVLASPPPAAIAAAAPNVQPIPGSSPPQVPPPQVAPQRSTSELPPPTVEGLPPAPVQQPVMPPPPPPVMQGLPPRTRAAAAPLLQWSRPAPASYVNIPVDPFQAPAQALPQSAPLPPTQQPPPMPQQPPQPQQSPLPQQPQSPQPPPPAMAARHSTGYIEQLWYSREPAHSARPAAEVAVPVQAPTAPPQRAAWQPPVATPPAFVIPQPAYQPPPQQPAYQPQPRQPAYQLPQSAPQQPGAPPQTTVWQPPVATPPASVIPQQPPVAGQRLPPPASEPQPSRLPSPAPDSPLSPAQRLPRPAPDARSENEMQRLPMPNP